MQTQQPVDKLQLAVERWDLELLNECLENKHDQILARKLYAKVIFDECNLHAARIFHLHGYHVNEVVDERFFQQALQEKKYRTCRYLIEHGFNLDRAETLLDQAEQTPSVEDLITILQECRHITSEKERQEYYIYCLKIAIEDDMPREASYVQNVLGQLPQYHKDYNFLQLAVIHGKLNVVRDLLWSVNDEVLDRAGNNLLMLAAMYGKFKVVKYLCDTGEFMVCIQKNKSGQTACEIAGLNNHIKTALYLHRRKLVEEKEHAETFLHIPSKIPLGQEHFVKEDFEKREYITPKGKMLVLNDLVEKYNPDCCATYVRGEDELITWIKLFAASCEQEAYIYFDQNPEDEFGDPTLDHSNMFKLEKRAKFIFIICIDSYYANTNNSFIKYIAENASDLLDQIVYCENQENQQTDTVNCEQFALTNMKLCLKRRKKLTDEILPKDFVPSRTHGVFYFRYRLPEEFMYVAQSYDKVKEYSRGCQNPEAFLESVYRPIDQYGIQSPQPIPNKHYNPDDKKSKEPEQAFRNLKIEIHKRKYVSMAKDKFKQLNIEEVEAPTKKLKLMESTETLIPLPEVKTQQAALRTALNVRRAATQVIDPDTGKLVNADELKKLQAARWNKFIEGTINQLNADRLKKSGKFLFTGTFFDPEFIKAVNSEETMLDGDEFSKPIKMDTSDTVIKLEPYDPTISQLLKWQ